MSSGLATVLAALLSLATTGPFNSKVFFPYGSFPGSQVLPGSQDALVRCLYWQPIGPAFALRWAFSRRIPSACRHRSVHLFLLSLVYKCMHRQPNMESPPYAGCHRGPRTTTLWRGAGYTSHLELIDSKCSEIQVEPRFCPIRLRQRF